jgi:hypothetical protein
MIRIARDVCCACILLGNVSYYFFSLEILFKKFKVHPGIVTRSVISKPVRSNRKLGPIINMTTAVYP